MLIEFASIIITTDFLFSIALEDSNNVYGSRVSVAYATNCGTFATIKYDQSENSIEEVIFEKPQAYWLSQNYPNPFNPSTTIRFQLRQKHFLTLVFNISGQEVATLVNSWKQAGVHEIQFNANQLPIGVYLYRLKVYGVTKSRKLLILR